MYSVTLVPVRDVANAILSVTRMTNKISTIGTYLSDTWIIGPAPNSVLG